MLLCHICTKRFDSRKPTESFPGRLSVLLQPGFHILKMNCLSSGIIWGSLCNFRNVCASDPHALCYPLSVDIEEARPPGLGRAACFLGNGRKTAWGQLLTACLTCIYLHWPSSISKKCQGPAVRQWGDHGKPSCLWQENVSHWAGRTTAVSISLDRHAPPPNPLQGWVSFPQDNTTDHLLCSVFLVLLLRKHQDILSHLQNMKDSREAGVFRAPGFIGGWDMSLISN